MTEEKATVNAEAVGVKKDGFLIFKLVEKGYGEIGPERAKELDLHDIGYKFGEFKNYLPVIDEEGEADEPELTEGFINEKQPVRGELIVDDEE